MKIRVRFRASLEGHGRNGQGPTTLLNQVEVKFYPCLETKKKKKVIESKIRYRMIVEVSSQGNIMHDGKIISLKKVFIEN